MTDTLTFKDLAKKIMDAPPRHRQRMIAIDGGGGAGKTTFAARLQKEIAGSFIIEIDSFYRPPQLRAPELSTNVINYNFDWDRFHTLVLKATANNQPISYQLYNFDEGTLSGKMIFVPSDATIIIEGVWSLQEAFADFYDYRIWLETPARVRLERGLKRDGEAMRQVWENEWIPTDENYKEMLKPQLQADCVVDSGSSDFQHDRMVIL